MGVGGGRKKGELTGRRKVSFMTKYTLVSTTSAKYARTFDTVRVCLTDLFDTEPPVALQRARTTFYFPPKHHEKEVGGKNHPST